MSDSLEQLKGVKDRQKEWYFDVELAHKYGLVNEIF
jgi:hypothetical protein